MSAAVLWRGKGRRYAGALIVDALGDGMLRPFLLLYAVTVQDMALPAAGLALSIGFAAGLLALPPAGRWLDAHGGRGVAMAALLIRAGGLLVLLTTPGPAGFTAAAVLLGVGSQVFPPAHAAVIARLVSGRDRDATLAAARALRNAGMGAGALIATLAVSNGGSAMRALASIAAALYVTAAVTVRLTPVPPPIAVQQSFSAQTRRPAPVTGLLLLNVANLPFALCFEVLEVALPAVLVTQLHVSAAWSSALFVGNTLLVIATQLIVVRRIARFQRRVAFAFSGALLSLSYLGFLGASNASGTSGAMLLCLIAVLYTAGEIGYAGTGTALVAAAAPPHELGRHLARWQLSTGLGRAVAPVTLTALLTVSSTALWLPLALATALASWVVARYGPRPLDRDAESDLSHLPKPAAATEAAAVGIVVHRTPSACATMTT